MCYSPMSLQHLFDAGVFDDVQSLLREAGVGTGGPPDAPAAGAETILHNGNFLLAESARAGETVSAIAIRGGDIVDVGDAARIVAGASSTCRVVDLDGATVAPGFVEAHAH